MKQVSKIYCELCKKDTLSIFWKQKGLTLCLDCKRKLDKSLLTDQIAS